jgi:hypothetical protein
LHWIKLGPQNVPKYLVVAEKVQHLLVLCLLMALKLLLVLCSFLMLLHVLLLIGLHKVASKQIFLFRIPSFFWLSMHSL